MKKFSNKKLLVLTCAASMFLGIGFNAKSFAIQQNEGVISTRENIKRNVDPDVAYISFSVISKAKKTEEATESNNQKTKKVLNVLKPLLTEGETVKTTSFTVKPYYEYNSKAKKREQKGYEVKNKIKLKVKDLDKLGSLITKAVSNGANKVEDLKFTIEDTSDICNELIVQASKKARLKAENIAKSLNIKVVGVKHVSSSCSIDSEHRPFYGIESYGMARGGAPAMKTPIEPGELKIRGSIDIDFLIKN